MDICHFSDNFLIFLGITSSRWHPLCSRDSWSAMKLWEPERWTALMYIPLFSPHWIISRANLFKSFDFNPPLLLMYATAFVLSSCINTFLPDAWPAKARRQWYSNSKLIDVSWTTRFWPYAPCCYPIAVTFPSWETGAWVYNKIGIVFFQRLVIWRRQVLHPPWKIPRRRLW